MQRRQFSVEKLIKQLKTTAVKIGYENLSEIAVQSRVFSDAPKALSHLQCDVEREALAVANILTCINPTQIVVQDFIPTLTNPKYARLIQNWAANVIKHAASELLNEKNQIRPALLAALPASAAKDLTSHDVVLSYFCAVTQPLLEVVKQKLVATDSHTTKHIEQLSLLFTTLTQNKQVDELIRAEFQKRTSDRLFNTKVVFGITAGISVASWMFMYSQSSQGCITNSPKPITVKP